MPFTAAASVAPLPNPWKRVVGDGDYGEKGNAGIPGLALSERGIEAHRTGMFHRVGREPRCLAGTFLGCQVVARGRPMILESTCVRVSGSC